MSNPNDKNENAQESAPERTPETAVHRAVGNIKRAVFIVAFGLPIALFWLILIRMLIALLGNDWATLTVEAGG